MLPDPRKQLEKGNSFLSFRQSKGKALASKPRKDEKISAFHHCIGKENCGIAMAGTSRRHKKKSRGDKIVSSALLEVNGRSAMKHTIQGDDSAKDSPYRFRPLSLAALNLCLNARRNLGFAANPLE